jgi:hypothetical protein
MVAMYELYESVLFLKRTIYLNLLDALCK